jgi:hypothetical protein
MVVIDHFLEELYPLRDFTVLRDFFALFTDIHFIFGAFLCHTKIQIKLEFGFDPLIFHELMALGLGKKNQEISVFALFFIIFISYLAHCFAIPRYRSSLSLI